MPSSDPDPRTVLTLDAGGTNLKFSAIQGDRLLFAPIYIPSQAHDLDRCLANIVAGFEQTQARLRDNGTDPAVAISFAFPGPADYPAGIIGDLRNLPGFRGGVALGPMLEDRFGLPVFINNDGNLFAYGEAQAGFLPHVNAMLAAAGNPKRYRNLFGVTLGTGLGGGVVCDGRLLIGDNSSGGEANLLRHKLEPRTNAEEGACIRAVRNVYARQAGIMLEDTPEPRVIADIARGDARGRRPAAAEAFWHLGEVVGDVLAQALTLLDGVAVIGGGLAAASDLFMPAVIAALRDVYPAHNGYDQQPRLGPRAFDVDNPAQAREFTARTARTLRVPGSGREVTYDPALRIPVGLTRLGTSEAVAIGAYAFALQRLDATD